MAKSKLSIFEILIAIYYTWFFTPIVNAYFSSTIFKYIFFGMFAAGMVGMVLIKGRANNVPFNRMAIAVIAYFIVMALMYIGGVGDASAHIRVSFTFWGTMLLYFYALDDAGRLRMGKYFLFLFVLTAITSSIGVIVDNEAARTIAHAAADEDMQMAYKMKNIGSVFLFQGMVLTVPSILGISKKKKSKLIAAAICVVLFVVLINASFTISLISFLIVLLLMFVFSKSENNSTMLFKSIASIVIAVLVIFGKNVLIWFANSVNNDRIYERIVGLVSLIYGGGGIGESVSDRMSLYKASWDTFTNNIFGTGPHYTYNIFEDGIGYHSQFLDDLARYGIFAIAFYAMFLSGYYRLLKREWEEKSPVPLVTTVVYALLLTLNIGFRTGNESVIMLFIIPVFPRLIPEIKRDFDRILKKNTSSDVITKRENDETEVRKEYEVK